jgi:Tol biopolymer transport system component
MTKWWIGLVVVAAAVLASAASATAPIANGRIAFARYDPALDDNITYTANPDGSDVQPLLPGFTSNSPHWSPDGTEVAVFSGLGTACPPSCTGNTVIINPDTGSYRVLAPQGFPAVSTFCSIWSPDATHFACGGGNDNDPSVNGVYTIRSSDGGDLTRITNGNDIPIDYSPDGTQIVFGRSSPHCNALYVVNVNGSGPQQITPCGFSDDDGSWSPDGTEIAFEHQGSLFVVHPDGTGLTKISLVVGSRYFAGDFSWSPDGTKLVFLLFTQTSARTFDEALATANADGSDVQRLPASPTFDHEPDWGSHPVTP